jgi:hypothetical protein
MERANSGAGPGTAEVASPGTAGVASELVTLDADGKLAFDRLDFMTLTTELVHAEVGQGVAGFLDRYARLAADGVPRRV